METRRVGLRGLPVAICLAVIFLASGGAAMGQSAGAERRDPWDTGQEPLALSYGEPAGAGGAAERIEPWACAGCSEEISEEPPYGYDGDRALCRKCFAAFEGAKRTTESGVESKPYDIMTTKELTGDWFGARTQMRDVGVDFAPMLISNFQWNVNGGTNTHNAHEITGRLFYSVELDFGKMDLIPGGSFFFRAVQSWNNGIRRHTGTTIAPYVGSGAPGDFFYGDRYPIMIDKWWYRQRLFDDRLEFRLGKIQNLYDLFDKSSVCGNYSSRFMNQALNVNLTIPAVKGFGAYVNAWPTDWLYFRMSAINSDSRNTRFLDYERALHGQAHYIGNWEFGFTPKLDSANGKLPGNYKFGWWYNARSRRTKWRNTFGGRLANDTGGSDVGFHLLFDQMLWKENNVAADKQGLSAFFRYGYAHGDVNRREHAWNLGAVYVGAIPTRDKDVLGFGVGQTMDSEKYRSKVDTRADRETVYELFYSIHVAPWLEIGPDLQIITNPGSNKDARDAFVGGIRAKVRF